MDNLIVLGATGPLGRACIAELAPRVNRVFAIARCGAKLEQLVPEYGNLTALVADMGRPEDRERMHAGILSAVGPEDCTVVLYCLGSHRDTPPGSEETVIRSQVDSNLTWNLEEALFWASRIHRGHFIFFADAGAACPGPGYHAYMAAKAGVVSLTRTLAQDLAPDVRVNAVAPGIMNLKPGARPDARERWATRIPLGDVGSPAWIARAVVFLVDHPYLTGVVLPVDGGFGLVPRHST